MHGVYVPVRAEVVDVPHFSCHADAAELSTWLRSGTEAPAAVYVVHGEPRSSAAFAERLTSETGWCVVTPRRGERVLLQGRSGTT